MFGHFPTLFMQGSINKDQHKEAINISKLPVNVQNQFITKWIQKENGKDYVSISSIHDLHREINITKLIATH